MIPAPPACPDAATGARLRAVFAGYDEAAIATFLGVSGGAEAQSVAALQLPRHAARDTALGVLLRLFLAGQPVAVDTASVALGAEALAACSAAGMLEAAAGAVMATLRLLPVGELRIASDRRELHGRGFADFVVGPAPVSRILADLLLREPVERCLDLGCGSGLLGLQASAWAREVVVADLNPRAVAFARFNAALNGRAQVRGAVGDLFEAVAGERFDRIVCNPPFVISPAAEFIYRDGGTAICRRIVAAAPQFLAPGGCLQMLCNWPEAAAGDWRDGLAGWFGETGCDVWVLRLQALPAAVYAAVWLGQECGGDIPAERYGAWMDHLDALGAARVASGLVVMRSAVGRRPWIELREAPPCAGPAGASIARALAARDRLARLDDDGALLGLRLRPAPEVELRSARSHRADGWSGSARELRAGSGFGFAARIDPVLADLLLQLDGRRELRRVVEDWAAANAVPAAAFLPQLPAAIRRLLLLGLLDVA